MKALAANLKTLYQCPPLWFWHIIGLIFFIDGVLGPVAEPVAGQGEFMKFLIVSYWAGMMIASMMKETLGKPVTFCLPGHQSGIRSAIFALGGVQAMLFSLLVLAYPGLDATTRLTGMVSVACLAMTVYLLSVTAMFLMSNAAAFWGVPAIFLALSRHVFTGVRAAIEDAAIFHPLANAAVLIPVAILTWQRLGNRNLARRESGKTFMAMQYLFNRKALERYGRDRKIRQLERQSNGLLQSLEVRFLARMRRLPAFSVRRHMTGSRYVGLGEALPASPAYVVLGSLVALTFLVTLGFAMPSESPTGFSRANLLYLLPAILGMMVQIPVYSTLLVPAGRPARFRACLSIGLRGAWLVLLVSAALFGISLAIAAVVPEISVSGQRFAYLPMDPRLIPAALLVLPLLYACQIGVPRRPQIPQTVVLIAGVGLVLVAPGVFGEGVFPALAVLAALSWACFVGPLHHFCYHRDLALK